MPDLNFRTPAVREEMERLASLWLDRGVDGFRLDAARHLVEAGPGAGQVGHARDARLLEGVRRVRARDAARRRPSWARTGRTRRPSPTYYGSTAAIAGRRRASHELRLPARRAASSPASDSGDAAAIAAKLAEIQSVYPAGRHRRAVPDQPRSGPRRHPARRRIPAKLRNAAAILLTLPGAPFLYYGEEVGLQNGTTSNDEAKRTPMPWDCDGRRRLHDRHPLVPVRAGPRRPPTSRRRRRIRARSSPATGRSSAPASPRPRCGAATSSSSPPRRARLPSSPSCGPTGTSASWSRTTSATRSPPPVPTP